MPSNGGTDPARMSRLEQRALVLWPRLDHRAVRRCAGDARCIVRIVARRTTLPADAIRRLLLVPPVSELEVATWFG